MQGILKVLLNSNLFSKTQNNSNQTKNDISINVGIQHKAHFKEYLGDCYFVCIMFGQLCTWQQYVKQEEMLHKRNSLIYSDKVQQIKRGFCTDFEIFEKPSLSQC